MVGFKTIFALFPILLLVAANPECPPGEIWDKYVCDRGCDKLYYACYNFLTESIDFKDDGRCVCRGD
ncbi:hypothetical protein L596_013895 [Steinernema carpocapsae]|uniref:Uncharacterized protein n=1 Tax=Steinernema carpocapsae TaxID=34508 RepID=A0A4U5P2Y0_STECR|nr:hypothetical protein L596_013895 [Steinernema carpocapsae]